MSGTDHAKARRRKPWLALGLTAAFIGLLSFAYFRDDKLDDFSDLEPTPPLTPAADAVFEKWRKVYASGDGDILGDERDADDHLLDRIDGELPWRQEPVSRVLAANAKLLEGTRVADALGPFRFPVDRSFEFAAPYLGEIQEISKLLKLHSIDRLLAGDTTSATESALIGIRFADRAVAGSSTLIDLLVGLACGSIINSAVDQLVSGGLSEEQLSALATALGADEADFGALMQAMVRTEFRYYREAIEAPVDITDYFGKEGIFPRLQFRRNRTINAIAELARQTIPELVKPAGSRALPQPPPPPERLERLSSNAFGKHVIASSVVEYESILSRADDALAQRRALLVKIALVRYRNARGSLPPSLSDLVPEYLAAVPPDPHGGAPLRYDNVRGIVWSIGKDLTDGGGGVEPAREFSSRRAPDPTLWVNPIEIGPEPPRDDRRSRRSRRRSNRGRRTP